MKILATLTVLVCSFALLGQGDVDIYVKGNRVVEKANRMTKAPAIIDTVLPTPEVEYPKRALAYESEITVDSIDAAEIKMTERLPQLYHSYAKLGVGTEFMPLGEFYYNNTRSRKYHYGVHLNHLSSFGNLNGYAPAGFDRNMAKVFGAIHKSRSDLSGGLRFENNGYNYYGTTNDSLSVDSISQRMQTIGADFRYDLHKRDSGHLNYRIAGSYDYFTAARPDTGLWNPTEHNAKLNFGGSYLSGIHLLDVDVLVQMNQSKLGEADTSYLHYNGRDRSNFVIGLNPTATTNYLNDRLRAKAGMKIMFDVGAETRAYVYPDFVVKYSLFNDIFIPYAGLGGSLEQRSLQSTMNENPFVNPSVNLINENERIHFYGGWKGVISKRVSFDLGASFARVQNMALYVTDTLSPYNNQFEIRYDTLNRAVLKGSICYQQNEKLKIEGLAAYRTYMLLNNSFAWQMPLLELRLRGKYNLFDKLITQMDFAFYGGRRALVYEEDANTTVVNNQITTKLSDIYDINLSVEYLYSKRISAFIQFNNITAQNYQRWINYPVQAFQAMGGVTFKF